LRISLFGLALAALVSPVALAPVSSLALAGPADPYIWLEAVHSERADAWVAAENAKTTGVLEQDARFAGLDADALAIAEAKDRIPNPRFLAGDIYNFWQDADHVRGIWRKTSLDDYGANEPNWTTIIDLDQLSSAEKANWVWKGADCRRPDEQRCLVRLSDGGEDADTIREFDLGTKEFVKGGFELPTSKQETAWNGGDQILVARDWGPDSMTKSGYPYIVKTLERGQALDQAHEIFRGKPSDTEVGLQTFEDSEGHRAVFIRRRLSFFEAEFYLVRDGKPTKLSLPLKSEVSELVAGRLLVELNDDWHAGDTHFYEGSLVALDLDALAAAPDSPAPSLVYRPGPREALDEVSATKDQLIVTTYENVKGRAFIYTPTKEGGWTHRQLDLPDNLSIGIGDSDFRSDRAFLTVSGFLTPSTLLLADAASGETKPQKSLPAKFDASKDVVEQRQATSKDGTKIPYFIVHPKEMALNGENPTILYAYGGFQVSETPTYSANIGKLWLERGGVYVLANIRGGGEFGPAWHEAGLKTHRQRIYDDFAAVAKDLIATKVTSPRRLGIEGGSNGGLLVGVEFTQHPEMWHAVDIQVPLLDMLRFEQIAAGSSWVGEYGSVANPAERKFLASISPYNNLKAGVKYPEPFVWTTTKDDRVGPQHARKFAAKLAELHSPYLFYEVTEGGHGAGANLKERAKTTALEYTYFARKLMD
jgi:prolyl oligopeptidase